MLNISLFGTCTMKYHSPVVEQAAQRYLAELHPLQPEDTLQGVLAAIHGFDLILRELSGMDQFVFQAGGGADAAYTHAVVTRAWLQAKGELGQRDEIITSIQAHPCNAATAAAAGFKVVTLMLEEDGYPSVEALKAAVSNRTAALMINNPDDMGIYNPHIKEWVRIVHEAGGLAFYDHANFNGVMGKIRAARAGLRRLHVHAPQDLRRAQRRRRTRRRRLWLHGGAGAVPAGAGGRRGGRPLSARPATGRRAPARCASSGAMSRRW